VSVQLKIPYVGQAIDGVAYETSSLNVTSDLFTVSLEQSPNRTLPNRTVLVQFIAPELL